MSLVIGKLLYILMTWIFVDCSDYQGDCIRSYVSFGVAIVVALLSLFACIKNYQFYGRLAFEQLPLTINFLTSVSLAVIYSQKEIINIRMALLVIEVYSYFLLSYGFVYNVMRKTIQNTKNTRFLTIIFVIASVLAVAGIVIISILSANSIVNCRMDQLVGSFVVLILQIPLAVVSFFYSNKAKHMMKSGYHGISAVTQHLINEQDSNKKLSFLQMDLVRFAYVISVVLHIIELICFMLSSGGVICNQDTGRIVVNDIMGLYITSVENLSQLFPHVIIPIIFWYLIARTKFNTETLYMKKDNPDITKQSTKNVQGFVSETSNFVADVKNEETIRKKMSRQRLNSYDS